MLILGWHGNPRLVETDYSESFAYHDAAAAIIGDGRLIAAIEEERLDRIKHSSCFPVRAIEFCLREAHATFADVDAVVTDLAMEFCDFVAARDYSQDPNQTIFDGRQMIAAAFQRTFNVDVADRLHFCKHHLAHLYSAWHPSGFNESLVLTIDGSGDGFAGVVAHCASDEVRILRQIPESLSLGNFYLQHLAFLGFHRYDEYKAMGLAPYGNPATFASLFNRLYRLLPEGRFSLLPLLECFHILREAGLTQRSRRNKDPFSQEHSDFAAALQVALEQIVDHVLAHFQRVTGARNLCISGGVAHNCSMNGKVARSGRFERIYVQPAAHDAGNTIGAAIAYAHRAKNPVSRDLLTHLYLGTDVGSSEDIARSLQRWSPLITCERQNDIAAVAARMIAGGQVIGWVQGRSEFGPRALGNRSIIADPRPAEHKQVINAMVKKREAFRPFAPAVLEERMHEFFDVPASNPILPFMVVVVPVHRAARDMLAAVTHVDGTARVQSVSRKDNPRFHALIDAFGRLTGVPVVLNTSFNNHAEPIVDSIDDAVTTFLTTGLHALVIGDWLVKKPEDAVSECLLLELVPSLPATRKLVRRVAEDGVIKFGIESIVESSPPRQDVIEVSKEIFQLLLEDDRDAMKASVCRLGFDGQVGRLCSELWQLWSSRVIRMLPAATA